jgi:uncharacterized membrane protein
MLKYFAVYFSFLLSIVAIDLVWLLGIAKNLYRTEMGSLMATEPKLWAGLGFYLLYALGATIFVTLPAISKQSLLYAVQYGALFGLFCYMAYDLTNVAIVRDFPVRLAFMDIAWGSAATSLSAAIAYWISARIA